MNSRDLDDELEQFDATTADRVDVERLMAIVELKNEVSGWDYGIHFIEEIDFVNYARELLYEMHDIPEYIQPYIDWKAWAEALRSDYNEVDFEGTTYLWRE